MFPGSPVAGGEERTVQVAIGQDSEFYRHFFDTVLIDGASKRLHSRGPTNGGARPQTLLDHRKTLFSVCVELLGVVDPFGLDDGRIPGEDRPPGTRGGPGPPAGGT